MKRLTLLLFTVLSLGILSCNSIQAETYEYPFDSITITSAFQFQVTLTEEPNENSILYGNVSQGETFTVYVGSLEFMADGTLTEGSGSIMILTDSDDNDFARWLINSQNSSGAYITHSFGSWIQINPTLGVVKDLTNPQKEIGYRVNQDSTEFIFEDDLNMLYPMVTDSYVLLEDLNIQVSAYEESE